MVREAVKDALLDVIGTVLLLGIAFVLVIAGLQAVFSSISLGTVAVSIGVTAVGICLAAATLEIIPPIRAWLCTRQYTRRIRLSCADQKRREGSVVASNILEFARLLLYLREFSDDGVV